MEARREHRFITEAGAAQSAVGRLLTEGVVGLDTETYWEAATKQNRVSLVQIAPREGEVLVIDVLSAGVEPLRPLVESPSVLMTAHNARFDELVLMGAGLNPAALVDTLRLARSALFLRSYSLAAVAAELFGVALDKTLRNSNWRRRPLSKAQIDYAATDAHVTLLVYEELKRRLEAEGRWERVLRGATLRGEPPREKRKKRQPSSPPPPLTAEERRAVTKLKKWRLERSFAQRVPAYMICPDRTLEALAHARPRTLEDLRTVYGLGESKIATLGEDLLKALEEAFS